MLKITLNVLAGLSMIGCTGKYIPNDQGRETYAGTQTSLRSQSNKIESATFRLDQLDKQELLEEAGQLITTPCSTVLTPTSSEFKYLLEREIDQTTHIGCFVSPETKNLYVRLENDHTGFQWLLWKQVPR